MSIRKSEARSSPALKKAYEQSPAAVQRWLRQDDPAIAARAKAEGAEIHWGDESGLRSDDVRGRSFAPKGQTPVVRINQSNHPMQRTARELRLRAPSSLRSSAAADRERSAS